MAWGKVGSKTVATQTNEYTVDDITASDFNFCIASTNVSANQGNSHFRFNGSTGTTNEYAFRTFRDFEYLGDGTTQALIPFAGWSDGTKRYFTFSWIYNKSDKEKLTIGADMSQNTAGSGATANVPHQSHMAGKWVKGTPEAITKITFNDSSSGEISADTTFNMLGSDVTPAPSTPAVPAIPALMPSLQSPSVGGWVELARTTLGSSNDDITVSSLADKRYLMIMTDNIPTGSIWQSIRYNSDTGSNYANRYSNNGGSDVPSTSLGLSYWGDQLAGTNHGFGIGYTANLAGKEKLALSYGVNQNTAGSGTAPDRTEVVSKWANTSDAINAVTNHDQGSGSFASGSEVVVLGWDPTDTHTSNFWEELASVELGSAGDNLSSGTISAKKYLWLQAYLIPSGTVDNSIQVNNDTGTNYAMRNEYNGAGDNVFDSLARYYPYINAGSGTGFTTPMFINIFIINNASDEKLFISQTVMQNTAGASNASNRNQSVGKWANTSNQITEIEFNNGDSGNYNTGSFIKVWGSD